MEKNTYRSIDDKKKIMNRLNRIEGQISGVKKMVDEDRYCDDILIQLEAIKNSVKSLSNVILERHLCKCVTNSLENGDLGVIDEVINLFRRYK